MSHQAGEHLRCDKCGAEILYVKACPCPADERAMHVDLCCGEAMRTVDVQPTSESVRPAPHPHP